MQKSLCLAQIAASRGPDGIIRGTVSEGLDSRRGLLPPRGDEVAAVHQKQVGNIVGAAEWIHNGRARVVPHPASSHEVPAGHVVDDVERLAPSLQGTRRLEDLDLLRQQPFHGRHVMRVVVERDADSGQAPRVLHVRIKRNGVLRLR